MDRKTAILVDGSFFLYRAKEIWGSKTPEAVASLLISYCNAHLRECEGRELYRIYFYDCPPADIDTRNPISGGTPYAGDSSQTHWRQRFYHALTRKRKLALRMGVLDTSNPVWQLSGKRLEDLIEKKISVDDLKAEDLRLQIRQKGVDLHLGLDMASLAYKGLVDQIILISGDSDFVPAAMLVRREGIDIILDPMWLPIGDNLIAHVDGLRSMVWRYPDGSINPEIGYRPDRHDKIGAKANGVRSRANEGPGTCDEARLDDESSSKAEDRGSFAWTPESPRPSADSTRKIPLPHDFSLEEDDN